MRRASLLVVLAFIVLGNTGPCIPVEPEEPIDCDDHDVCTVDTRDPAVGCVFEPVADGTPCDDADACTVHDVCLDGQCHGEYVGSDPGNPCVEEVCDPETGSYLVFLDGAMCDDGDACTVDDVCHQGQCYGVPFECDDGDPCTRDVCDSLFGCVHRATENCDGDADHQCHDAIDNDGDGLIDFDDPDCATVPCCPD